MNRNESKYFNTAVKMDKALIALLAKKDFEYITIKEICDKAEVNRSTFYLHYQNTRELLEESTKYVLNDFFSYFSNEIPVLPNDNHSLIYIRPEYIIPYLTYVKENQAIFKTVMKHIGTMGFENVYKSLFQKVFEPALAKYGCPENEREYIIRFYLTGLTAVTMQWLKNGCDEPIEQIAKIMAECILARRDID